MEYKFINSNDKIELLKTQCKNIEAQHYLASVRLETMQKLQKEGILIDNNLESVQNEIIFAEKVHAEYMERCLDLLKE